MFVKLFMGMGFIWTFEIVAGLIGDSVSEEVWWVQKTPWTILHHNDTKSFSKLAKKNYFCN